MVDLLCVEKLVDRLAEADPVIFGDSRVLGNLLQTEAHYVPKCNYFSTRVQRRLQPFMRRVVAAWMMEVCEEERCEAQVFSTAVNILDRFLCECLIDKNQLQMVACVCLLVASKVRQCHALSVSRLVYYTDYSVTADEIRKFELVLLGHIKWDLSTVTGFDYVDHVLERVPWSKDRPLVRRHARTLVDLVYAEGFLFRSRPSLIATACILAAARGLNVTEATTSSLCVLTMCAPEDVEEAVVVIDNIVDSQAESRQVSRPPPATAAPSKHTPTTDEELRQPETPTDVQEIFF